MIKPPCRNPEGPRSIHAQARVALYPLIYRGNIMATACWADIYDDSDHDSLGPWATYPRRPRSPSPLLLPPAGGTGLRWADIYDGDDDGDLGPWANYPTMSRSPSPVHGEKAAKKKKNRGRRRKKRQKASVLADLAREAGRENLVGRTGLK